MAEQKDSSKKSGADQFRQLITERKKGSIDFKQHLVELRGRSRKTTREVIEELKHGAVPIAFIDLIRERRDTGSQQNQAGEKSGSEKPFVKIITKKPGDRKFPRPTPDMIEKHRKRAKLEFAEENQHVMRLQMEQQYRPRGPHR